MKEKTSRSICLLSGGVDSAVAATCQTVDECLFVDYGQPALRRESAAVDELAGRMLVPVRRVVVRGMNLGDMATQKGASVVPHRNAVLVSIAANLGATKVVVGWCADDQLDYADCTDVFRERMERALNPRSGDLAGQPLGGTVRIAAPLIDVSKPEVVRRARQLGVLDICWSCYYGGGEPCGECASCLARARCPTTGWSR